MLRTISALICVCGAAGAQGRSFDVASVKPADRPFLELAPQRSGGRIVWTTDLGFFTSYAYHLERFRVSGAIPGDTYRVEATTAASTSEQDVRQMFQSLLADRFKLAAHRVTKEEDGYTLTVGRSGLKIKEAVDNQAEPMPEWFSKISAAALEGKVLASMEGKGIGALTGRRVTMAQLAESLTRVLRVFVRDETELSGKYYFAFQFAPENAAADTDLPPLAAALQEKLGLKLEKRKGPVEMLVVDHVEKTPTEN